MRAAFIVDFLRDTLYTLAGLEPTHVMNITDVGHLTGDNEWDANTGEDRMEKWARKEWLTAREVAQKYTDIYLQDLEFLGIDAWVEKWHDIYMPRATDHIQEQIDMIKQLEDKWYTYIVKWDGVYMDTSKFKNYGVLLSDKHLEGIQKWSRVDLKGKISSTDFALRKFNMTGKKRDMERESPRWIGFPWRHIECSAMSVKYLWEQFDIHTGGMEHIPVHHTNEIAQAECSCATHPWVNYWIHYQWLMMNGKKIAKSDGNVAYISQIKEQWYTWKDVRMFFLQAHYRSFQDFTREGLQAAKKTRHNLQKKLKILLHIDIKTFEDFDEKVSAEELKALLQDTFIFNLLDELLARLADDLNTPECLATIQHAINTITEQELVIDTKELYILIHRLDTRILKLWLLEQEEITIPFHIQSLAQARREAKQTKDYTKADELRQQLHDAGREMLDGKDGYEIQKM